MKRNVYRIWKVYRNGQKELLHDDVALDFAKAFLLDAEAFLRDCGEPVRRTEYGVYGAQEGYAVSCDSEENKP